MTSKEKLALIKETWYDVDLTDEKYSDFDEEQTFNDLEKDLEVLEILKDKEVDVNYFKTLIPYYKEEDLMKNYNLARWKGKLTLEETIKIKGWLNNGK